MILDELKKGLDSSDEETRRQAVESLLEMSFESGMLPILTKAMGDASWRVRKSAVNAALSFKDNTEVVSSIMSTMIDVLHSEDNAGLRNSAVECLTRLDKKSLPYLIKNLNDIDIDVRKFIVDVLGDIGGANKRNIRGNAILGADKDDSAEMIVDSLIKATQDIDENIRLSAIEGLGKVGNSKAVKSLLEILDKGDIALKFTTLEALGNIGISIPMNLVYDALKERLLKRAAYGLIGKAGGIEAVPYLIEGLKEISTSTRESAIAAVVKLAGTHDGILENSLRINLAKLTSSDIEKIAASMDSQDLNVKAGVVFILGSSMRKDAVGHIIRALSIAETSDKAKEALIKMGDEALEIIIDSYSRQEEQVRAFLCYVLGEIGNKEAEKILVKAIKDDYGHVRSCAAIALGKISQDDAADKIIDLLKDEYNDVKNAAVDALSYFAVNSNKPIIPRILPLLSSADPYVREKVIILLGRIGRTEDIEKVRIAIKDGIPLVRKAAVLALGEIGDKQYIQDIIFAIADEDREVKLAAAKVLGNIISNEAADSLVVLLTDKDIWIKTAAVESLGKIGTEKAVQSITGLLDDENGLVVCSVLEALAMIAIRGHLSTQEIKPYVMKCLSHVDTEVVKVAAQILGRLDKKGSSTQIVSLLKHTSWDVRAQVVDILSDVNDDFIRNCFANHFKVETDDLVRQKLLEVLKG